MSFFEGLEADYRGGQRSLLVRIAYRCVAILDWFQARLGRGRKG